MLQKIAPRESRLADDAMQGSSFHRPGMHRYRDAVAGAWISQDNVAAPLTNDLEPCPLQRRQDLPWGD